MESQFKYRLNAVVKVFDRVNDLTESKKLEFKDQFPGKAKNFLGICISELRVNAITKKFYQPNRPRAFD